MVSAILAVSALLRSLRSSRYDARAARRAVGAATGRGAALAVAEQAEQPLDFAVGDRAAQADAVDVAHRHEHGRVVGNDAQMIEAAGSSENSFVFDAFDDAETVIRVNDLVADFKCHGSP